VRNAFKKIFFLQAYKIVHWMFGSIVEVCHYVAFYLSVVEVWSSEQPICDKNLKLQYVENVRRGLQQKS